MNFQGFQATYRRLYNEHPAWRLLRAENAPYVLAFIADLFCEDSEVPYGRARITLDAEIEKSRALGIWATDSNAGTYLNHWIHNGWLREMDDMLTKTDASEIALRFAKGLDERSTGTSASHLRIVQEAVRDFAIAINPNLDERVAVLERKKAEIQREIDDLQAGVAYELSDVEQKERMIEIYQLASVLTGDFRRVEDDIRQLDKALRVQIIEADTTRGEVLSTVMEKEALLSTTDAGSAFEGFFNLLCDQARSTEFREQLRSILNRPIAKQLSTSQHHFLAQLMRELTRESDRVFRVRRRTEEGLRSYIESGAAADGRAVDALLSQLEKAALAVRETQVPLNTNISLELPIGPIEIRSPESLRLKCPDETLDTRGVLEQVNARTPNANILSALETVQIKWVAQTMVNTLKSRNQPMSLSAIAKQNPINDGLEELVAYLRVAKAVKAPQIGQKEPIEISDKQGHRLNASIPLYVLSAQLFPDNLDELVV